ncbi:MAG: DUF1311 domain-containing protein [Methylococcaceae bacterium]|nr:DUF1311 domain-containing protein [Methylococcaceae bacterium]
MKNYALLLLLASAAGSAYAEPKYSSAFDLCMDKSNGTTVGMITCLGDETDRQDKKLNTNYKALKVTLNKKRQKQLLDVQRMWIKFRDANCDFYYDPEGGSMHRVMSNECYLRMTAERALELEQLNMSY